MYVSKRSKYTVRYVGEGYSSFLFDINSNEKRTTLLGLPILRNTIQLSNLLGISIPEIRFITYHEKLSSVDHYYRYVKKAQRAILEKILMKINIPEVAHGFIQGRSILTNAKKHLYKPEIIIKMDIKDFFPSITFERVRGMFHFFGYSGYISTLLSMICTDANRTPFQQNGKNISLPHQKDIFLKKRLSGLAESFFFQIH